MTTGHYAPAFALKRQFPEAPLWQLFLGVQAVDVLFFLLVPWGIERLTLVPGEGIPLGLHLTFMPYTHSLAAGLLYGGIAWGVGRLVGRGRVGFAIGLAILSHWLCDVAVHTPDMPVLHDAGVKLGFGIWNWPVLSFVVELGFLALTYRWLRARLSAAAQRAGDLCFGTLCAVQYLSDWVMPAPDSILQLVLSAQLLYAVSTWLAVRVDQADAHTTTPAP